MQEWSSLDMTLTYFSCAAVLAMCNKNKLTIEKSTSWTFWRFWTVVKVEIPLRTRCIIKVVWAPCTWWRKKFCWWINPDVTFYSCSGPLDRSSGLQPGALPLKPLIQGLRSSLTCSNPFSCIKTLCRSISVSARAFWALMAPEGFPQILNPISLMNVQSLPSQVLAHKFSCCNWSSLDFAVLVAEMCVMAAILLLNNPAKRKLVKTTDMGMKDVTGTMGMTV